jgi:rare lipoprotein A
MKRIVLASCLAAITAATQAEASDHRRAKAADHPGRAEATLRWFATHAAAPAAAKTPAPVAQATKPQVKSDVKPRVMTVAVTPAETPAATPATPGLAASPVLPAKPPRIRHGGISSCSEGVRIITAYYVDGRRTASGERFDPSGMTAAHRTLPFGTQLKVTNPRNGKVVMVRVNDRGPFVKGVTLDLSRGAAQAIGLSGTGAVCMAQM